MHSVYTLKASFQKLLAPLAQRLFSWAVTANQITVAAALASVGYGLALGFHPESQILWLCLPLFLFARMAMNALDGMLARNYGQASKRGAFLNELCDIASDAALILGFSGLGAPLPTAIFAVTAALCEAAGLAAQAICGRRRYDGPFGKSDRAVAMGLFGCMLGIGIGIDNALLLQAFLWLCGAGALYTCCRRVEAALKEDT